jgi:hypothetical protein
MGRDSSFGIETGYRLGVVQEIFLFTTESIPTLGPTQPPIQSVSDSLSLEIKRQLHEADHSLPSSAEVKNTWIYTSTPIRVLGFVLAASILLAKKTRL